MPRIGYQEYRVLMEEVARAWSQQDTESALRCFAGDAVYFEPPDIQFYKGQDQLRAYFAALTPDTFMVFHNLWFDESKQVGAGEFSFGVKAKSTADHGVVIAEIRDGKIASWREYQRKGPSPFEEFVRLDGKRWQWHIGNYP